LKKILVKIVVLILSKKYRPKHDNGQWIHKNTQGHHGENSSYVPMSLE